MKKVKITVMKQTIYQDLIDKYENPLEHACNMKVGQVFIANGWEKPEGMCDSAWESMSAFVMTLARGGENFYNGWMKNKKSAMISCNDGFRPVSFLLETLWEIQTKYGWYGGRKAAYEEFLALNRDTENRYEYIDGEIYDLASPKTAHQATLAELFGIFFNWFQGKKCRPMVAPYDITLRRDAGDINVVQPDLMVICDLGEKLGENDYYKGVPDLIVEILSEGTRSKDLVKKLDLYMSCEVGEYWIVNPINREITIYLFKEKNIADTASYRKKDCAQSFHFKGLSAELAQVFR